jgi:hypothetical protein
MRHSTTKRAARNAAEAEAVATQTIEGGRAMFQVTAEIDFESPEAIQANGGKALRLVSKPLSSDEADAKLRQWQQAVVSQKWRFAIIPAADLKASGE